MISVIIPVFNAEKSIGNTLASVKNQTCRGKFEIIIINDGSTDGSAAEIEKFRLQNADMNIQVIHQENQGVSAARNVGLKMAKGEFIALLDADDIWLPEKTEKQLPYLNGEKANLDFISCRRVGHTLKFPFLPGTNKLAKVTFRKLLCRNEIPTPTVIFKSKILQNTGYFSENHRYAEDHNFWLKISLNNTMAILDEELVIAGEGKRSFGVSGLSGNLIEMEKGFQLTLRELYELKHLSKIAFVFYRIFYKLKYLFRLSRNLFYNLLGK